jgi:hypothetical protein
MNEALIEAFNWNAVSATAAIGALVLSVFVWLSQRRQDRRQVDLQERLASIEEARRADEIRSRDEDRSRTLVADVRVTEFRMERPGAAGTSDKLSITVRNRGPAEARNIDVALADGERSRRANHLGNQVEPLGESAGFYQIAWEVSGPRPLERLAPDEEVRFPFWFRERVIGDRRIRVEWEDGRGEQVIRPIVAFDREPAYRH